MPSAGEKYLGAWQETAARIQARDNVLLGFVALTSALIGASLTAGDQFAFVSVFLGYAAFATAVLTCHHDLIIGYLGEYQSRVSAAAGSGKEPEWFSQENFAPVWRARLFRDIAQIFIIVIGGVGGLVASKRGLQTLRPCPLGKAAVWWLSLVFMLLALIVIGLTYMKRQEIYRKMKRTGSLPA